jgi:hypothetical protein
VGGRAVRRQGRLPLRRHVLDPEVRHRSDRARQRSDPGEAKAAWGAKATAKLAEILPDKKACCFIDGARKEAEDSWVLASYRPQDKGRPLVIDQQKNPLVAADGKPYAGCWVNATVEIYTTGKPNMGVRCGLLGVQFLKDGDAFGGGTPPNPDDFEALAEGAGADSLA